MTQMADEAKAIPSEAPDAPWLDDDKISACDLHQHYTMFVEDNGNDLVDHPAHYNQGAFEVITIIQDKLTPEQYVGYLLGNCYKYSMRWQYKGGVKDLKKNQWYLNRLVEVLND